MSGLTLNHLKCLGALRNLEKIEKKKKKREEKLEAGLTWEYPGGSWQFGGEQRA